MNNTDEQRTIRVWDPIVRYGHWALVLAFAIAYVSSGDEPGRLHVWSGYAVAAIVAVRLVWGVIGSEHARFGDFAYSPGQAIAYLRALIAGTAKRYIGHSPAGGVMVFALLACLSGTVVTGLLADRGGESRATTALLLGHAAAAAADDDGPGERAGAEAGERGESPLGEAHELLANLTLALVLAHIAGVALAGRAHRENLVAAMVSGEKRV